MFNGSDPLFAGSGVPSSGWRESFPLTTQQPKIYAFPASSDLPTQDGEMST